MTQATADGLRGLVIRQPFVDWILDGKKTWEIRGSATKVQGRIALIAAGTGTIVGMCDLVDVRGPLTLADLKTNAKRLNETASEIKGPLYYGAHTYAWVLSSARRLPDPIAYRHPSGAVIWVKLNLDIAAKIAGSSR